MKKTNVVLLSAFAGFLTHLTCSGTEQTPETLALLAKPLTKSMAAKVWPTTGLRGFNIQQAIGPLNKNDTDPGLYISEAAFKKMVDWKVNLLRLWVEIDPETPWSEASKNGEKAPPVPATDLMAPYKRHLEAIRISLHLAEKYHMQVIITVGDIVGRKSDDIDTGLDGDGSDGGGSKSVGYEPELIRVWTFIAREFGKHPNLIGYDLLNEPHGKQEVYLWQTKMLPDACAAIRAIDKNSYLIVEPGPWGKAVGFSTLRPIRDPKIVYSFHHYSPHTYTAQGTGEQKNTEYMGKAYPGILKAFPTSVPKMWDKHELEKSMEAAEAFAKKNHALMYVGEFSTLRWAPGAAQWTKDSIAIFEKHRWSWCYHSYHGWNGYNPTFAAEDTENSNPDGGKMTDRLAVLIEAWKKNSTR